MVLAAEIAQAHAPLRSGVAAAQPPPTNSRPQAPLNPLPWHCTATLLEGAAWGIGALSCFLFHRFRADAALSRYHRRPLSRPRRPHSVHPVAGSLVAQVPGAGLDFRPYPDQSPDPFPAVSSPLGRIAPDFRAPVSRRWSSRSETWLRRLARHDSSCASSSCCRRERPHTI